MGELIRPDAFRLGSFACRPPADLAAAAEQDLSEGDPADDALDRRVVETLIRRAQVEGFRWCACAGEHDHSGELDEVHSFQEAFEEERGRLAAEVSRSCGERPEPPAPLPLRARVAGR